MRVYQAKKITATTFPQIKFRISTVAKELIPAESISIIHSTTCKSILTTDGKTAAAATLRKRFAWLHLLL